MTTIITKTIEVEPNSPYITQRVTEIRNGLSNPEAYAALALFADDGLHNGQVVTFDREDGIALVAEPDRRHGVLMCIVGDDLQCPTCHGEGTGQFCVIGGELVEKPCPTCGM